MPQLSTSEFNVGTGVIEGSSLTSRYQENRPFSTKSILKGNVSLL
jgi:hypothetical protein